MGERQRRMERRTDEANNKRKKALGGAKIVKEYKTDKSSPVTLGWLKVLLMKGSLVGWLVGGRGQDGDIAGLC